MFVRVGLFLLTMSAICSADQIVDTFAVSQSCSFSFAPPYGTCDVIGELPSFDIQSANVTVTSNWVSLKLQFNFPNPDLAAFNDAGVTLNPGDVLFFDPSDPKTTTYNDLSNYSGEFPTFGFGVPLISHDGLIAGDLYRISYANDPSPLQTADDVLQNGNAYYRRNYPVWMAAGEAREAVGGGITVTRLGNGTTNALYQASFGFAPTADFLAMTSGGSLGVQWTVATCANDVLAGVVRVDPTPEPGTVGLLLIGLVVLFMAGRRRA